MKYELQPSYSPESDSLQAEQFISLSSVKRLVRAGIASRIDDDGYVKPEMIRSRLTYDSETGERWAVGPDRSYERPGMLLPKDTTRHLVTKLNGDEQREGVIRPDIESLIYSELTSIDHTISLDESDISKLKEDTEHIEDAIRAKGYDYKLSQEQMRPAYHIDGTNAPRDFDPLRIYVPAGTNALELATRVLQYPEVDMYGAKIWVPHFTERAQKFRLDTPIFEVTTFQQLSAMMNALRGLSRYGTLPITDSDPIVGLKVPDLPGVYVGQRSSGKSFNGIMRDLFAPSIEHALRLNNLHSGDKVTDEWLEDVAVSTRDIARANSLDAGLDPANHAFLSRQPTQKIVQTIAKAGL